MKNKPYIEFPACWEEVRPNEFQQLLALRHKMMNKNWVNLTDVKRYWCAYIVQQRVGKSLSGESFHLLVNQLADTLEWVFCETVVDGRHMIELTYDTTVNLLPVWREFIGPQSHGADLTFGEFRHAVTAFNRYNQDHELQDLRALCAILYRIRVKVDGSWRRPPFQADKIPHYMGLIRQMPEWLMWGVYAWFAYFCQYLQTGDFIIDGSTVCFAPVFTNQGGDDSRGGQSIGMNAIRFSVAETGVFGDAEQIDRTPLLQVMLKVLDDRQRAEDLLNRSKLNNHAD